MKVFSVMAKDDVSTAFYMVTAATPYDAIGGLFDQGLMRDMALATDITVLPLDATDTSGGVIWQRRGNTQSWSRTVNGEWQFTSVVPFDGVTVAPPQEDEWHG